MFLLSAMLPLRQRLMGYIRESRTLTQLRDTLLPKPICGQLRAPAAVAFLKERGL